MNSFKDSDTWLYYFMTSFPFAWLRKSTDDDGSMLENFIQENYQLPNVEWVRKFTGGWDESGHPVEPWTGETIDLPLNKDVCLHIEFHLDATEYYFNNVYVGEAGGHSKLSLLSWQELMDIVGDRNREFFFLLPLATGNEEQKEIIRNEINRRLENANLPFNKTDFPPIAEYLTRHLVHDKPVTYSEDQHLGIITDRNHSCRNPQGNYPEEIIEINRLIELAMQ